MSLPKDAKLTPVQFEIMQAVWGTHAGATVAEVWETISVSRDVGRTTVLNLMNRLEARGWLRRCKRRGVYRYQATIDHNSAVADAAGNFVDDFFGGSASELVLSLLGSQRLSKSEVAQLRDLLNLERPIAQQRKGKA